MSREKGFTLLEILLALSILAVVGAMVGYGLHATVQVVEETRAQRQVFRGAQRAFSRITDDLNSVVAVPDIGFEAKGPGADLENATILRFASLAHLDFAVHESGPILAEIQYSMARDIDEPEEFSLIRHDKRILPGAVEREETSAGFALARGLRTIHIVFFDADGQEVDTWDSLADSTEHGDENEQILPRAVRITLDFWLDKAQRQSLLLETVIGLPISALGGENRQK